MVWFSGSGFLWRGKREPGPDGLGISMTWEGVTDRYSVHMKFFEEWKVGLKEIVTCRLVVLPVVQSRKGV